MKRQFSYLLLIVLAMIFFVDTTVYAAVYTVANALIAEKANAKANPSSNTNVLSNIISEENTNENVTVNNQDPYETYNRHAYKLNRALDKVLFKPVATVYQHVLPTPVTKGVTNFFSNLNSVPTVFNDVLQLQFHQGIIETLRFLTNSTVGIGGLFDIATKIGLPKHSEDFGLTLAKWGYKSSNYLVLPILGPSTVRDTIGLPVDYETAVTAYVYPIALRNSLWGLTFVSHRANLLKLDKVIDQAYDPYVFERDAYMQLRAYQMKNHGLIGADNSDGAENSNGKSAGVNSH